MISVAAADALSICSSVVKGEGNASSFIPSSKQRHRKFALPPSRAVRAVLRFKGLAHKSSGLDCHNLTMMHAALAERFFFCPPTPFKSLPRVQGSERNKSSALYEFICS